MLVRGLAAAVGALFLLVACDDGGDKGGGTADATRDDVGVPGDDGGVGGGAGGGGGGGHGGGAGGGGSGKLRLSYVKEISPRDGSAGTLDLMLYDFDEDREYNLTNGAGDGVSCIKSCVINRSMSWVGWLTPGAAGGFELWVAPVDTNRELVKLEQKRKVADQVNTFNFTRDETRDLLVYTQGEAVGAGGTMEVHVEPVIAPAAGSCPNADDLAACPQLVDTINGDGAFRVTDFGATIIVVKTTLSSMTLGFFNVSNGANQTLYTFGDEGGTGSEFSGQLPVALSPDATYLAVFTRNDAIWRLQTLEASPSPPPPTTKDLFEVATNRAGDCQREMPYNFNDVRFDPRFSADGEYIYFLAKGDCTQRSTTGPTNRPDFDILKIKKDLSGDAINVTNNPRVSNWINHDIGAYDLSPDGTKLVFTASRPYDAQSRSVWLIDPATGEYDCSRGSSEAGIDGKTRCEFLFDELDNAAVIFRDIHFHEVGG